jgi:hypothetical protein
MKLVAGKFSIIKREDGFSRRKNSRRYDKNYFRQERFTDDISVQIVVKFQNDSGSSNCGSSKEEEEEVLEEDGGFKWNGSVVKCPSATTVNPFVLALSSLIAERAFSLRATLPLAASFVTVPLARLTACILRNVIYSAFIHIGYLLFS